MMYRIRPVSERTQQFSQQQGRVPTMQERWELRAQELNEYRAKGGDPLPPSRILPPMK